jgi:Carbohydrate family 9 binding domain-like
MKKPLAGYACAVLVTASVALAMGGAPSSGYAVHRTSAVHNALLSSDDPAWAPAEVIRWGEPDARTSFRALWSVTGLYVRFDATDSSPWNTMTRRDDHLWDEEVVEIFLDINRSGRHYAELEISPANVVCDVEMISPAPDIKNDLAWDIVGLETRVAKRGSLWIPTAFLPWNAFRSLPSAKNATLPPTEGTAWRFNVFRIERPNGPRDPERGAIFAAWSPQHGKSFHDTSAFRDFLFTQ